MKAPKTAVMVTGGAGFVGQHVVRSLATRGHAVVSVYRKKMPEILEQVYPVYTDMGSPELIASALRNVETVVHLAWEGGVSGSVREVGTEALASGAPTPNCQVLKNLLAAMERSGTRRLIFLSAIGARREAQTPFLRDKYLAEHLILNSRIPEKVILRSAVVWGGQGRNDPFLRTIIRAMKFPVYPLPQKRGGLAPVHVRDLASVVSEAVGYALSEPAGILDVHGGECYQVRDIFKIVGETYVKRTRIPLGGLLGASLLPIVERDRRLTVRSPRLADYLAIGGQGAPETMRDNPLSEMMLDKMAKFSEKILD